ncbi:MAG: hypothetical protein FLDDKLPJ_00318 [Phycisphaerae bacterium]|nr:hypothetical protein [Phycisphaerae bacterium]
MSAGASSKGSIAASEQADAPPRISRRGQMVRVVVLCLTVLAVLAYAFAPAREFQRRVDCCRNLKGFYAGETALEALRCPRSGGGYDRVILPAVAVPFPHIIVVEPMANHGDEGGAVLYSDGHAEFLMKGNYLSRIESDRERVRVYLASLSPTEPRNDDAP